MEIEVPTTEEIAQHYSALLDSVTLLEIGQPDNMPDLEWDDTVSRNKEHLELMKTRDFWTDEDFSRVDAVLL
jgi:hypothetical protein